MIDNAAAAIVADRFDAPVSAGQRAVELLLQPAAASRRTPSDVIARCRIADVARATTRFADDEQRRRLVLPVGNVDAGKLVEKELRS